MGLVSQEPVLFNTSIRDNIAYGDNSREVPMDEIIEAARKANVHQFINDLPNVSSTAVVLITAVSQTRKNNTVFDISEYNVYIFYNFIFMSHFALREWPCKMTYGKVVELRLMNLLLYIGVI